MAGWVDTLVDGFTSVIGDLGTTFDAFIKLDVIEDIVNGALVGGMVTAIGGGDILEGAAWSAAGNALRGSGDDGIFGSYADEVGSIVAGYGIDKSLGGEGYLGAAMGLGANYLEGGSNAAPEATPGGSAELASNGGDLPDDYYTKMRDTGAGATATSGGVNKFLEKFGLQDPDGVGTLMGKAALGAVSGLGASMMQDDAQENAKKAKEQTKELDEKFEQRDLRAFRTGSPLVVRNG